MDIITSGGIRQRPEWNVCVSIMCYQTQFYHAAVASLSDAFFLSFVLSLSVFFSPPTKIWISPS